jgi:hypothetical protein
MMAFNGHLGAHTRLLAFADAPLFMHLKWVHARAHAHTMMRRCSGVGGAAPQRSTVRLAHAQAPSECRGCAHGNAESWR